MSIELYNALEENGPTYSHFERLVLHQLHELNVSQNEHQAFCSARFQNLDDHIHNVTNPLSTFYNRNNSRNDWVEWLLGHALHFLCCIHTFPRFCQFLNQLFLGFNQLIISFLVSFSFFSSFLFLLHVSTISWSDSLFFMVFWAKILIFPNTQLINSIRWIQSGRKSKLNHELIKWY